MGRDSGHPPSRLAYGRVLALVAAAGLATPGSAQTMEPRSYSASPVGMSFAGVSLLKSTGDVVFDPAVPATNVSATIYGTALWYGHTFGLAGRQALVSVVLPYAWGTLSGDVQDQAATIHRSGLADFQARLSVNLIGSPALSPAAFAKEPQHFILGTSLTITAPTGQYDPTRLINLGTNRWTFKPELGISYPWKQFHFELYGAASYFTDNTSYYPGSSNQHQEPLTTVQTHLVYTFRQRLWLALDGTRYGGGAVSINHGPLKDRLENKRVGATLSVPAGQGRSVKCAYSRGVYSNLGTNFDTLVLSYQVAWF